MSNDREYVAPHPTVPTVGRWPVPSAHAHPSAVRCTVCDNLECVCRPRWFAGQVLSDADLESEQRWVITKNRLHNLHLHGSGVVCGMKVTCHPSCEGWVRISEGYAISPCGDDIVVCDPADFDVMAAIEACLREQPTNPVDCTPRSHQVECTPDGTWCITIRYTEWADRAVRPLRAGMEGGSKPVACAPRCSCGGGGQSGCVSCGSTTTRCGCGNGHGHAEERRTVRPGPVDPACEPTRWCEGYEIRLCRQPAGRDDPSFLDIIEGTLLGRVFECWTAISQAQALVSSYSTLYQGSQSLEQLRAEVGRLLDHLEITSCDLLDRFADVKPVRPPVDLSRLRLDAIEDEETRLEAQRYQAQIDTSAEALRYLSWQVLLFCLCENALPPCAPPATDDRLVLACLTVEDGRVTDICNYVRDQVVTWPAVRWWLSILPIEPMIRQLLEALCCGRIDVSVLGRYVANPWLAAMAKERAREPFDAAAFVRFDTWGGGG